MGRNYRSRYSVSPLLPYRALAIYRTQNAARVILATLYGKYARYIGGVREREGGKDRLLLLSV